MRNRQYDVIDDGGFWGRVVSSATSDRAARQNVREKLKKEAVYPRDSLTENFRLKAVQGKSKK